ncbi:MAG: hypothetical protein ACTHNG_03365 [Ginsengibacter sp.]
MQNEIDLETFAQIVKSMRKAQREYFAYRTKTTLKRSIEMEKRVDDIVRSLAEEKPIPKQSKLFL